MEQALSMVPTATNPQVSGATTAITHSPRNPTPAGTDFTRPVAESERRTSMATIRQESTGSGESRRWWAQLLPTQNLTPETGTGRLLPGTKLPQSRTSMEEEEEESGRTVSAGCPKSPPEIINRPNK